MKKVVSIALLALLGFGGLSAQERTKGEVEITPFIGYQENFLMEIMSVILITEEQ